MVRRILLALARFFEWLGGGRSDPAQAPSPDGTSEVPSVDGLTRRVRFDLHLPDFSVDDLARAMNLEGLGTERGLKELPPSDATTLDPVEIAICQQITIRVEDARREWERVASVDRVHAEAAGIRLGIHAIQVEASNAVAALEAEAKAPMNGSYKAREKARDAKQYLETFRKEHRLTRPARYPDSRIWHLAGVGALVAVEGYANGSILATGMYGGEVQGWSMAVALALFNAGVGFLMGWICRFVFHRSTALKIIGVVLIFVSACYGLFVNLGVAHFRDALNLNPDDAPALALKALVHNPFDIANFYSVLLFIMGGAFFIIAFITGIAFFEEIYPGYGFWTRNKEQKLEDFGNLSEDGLRQLGQCKDEKLRTVRIEAQHLRLQAKEYAENCARLNEMRLRAQNHEQILEASADSLAEIYRQSNLRARHTPAPDHFKLPLSCRNGEVATEVESPLADFHLEQLEECSAKIIEAFKRIQQSFPTLEDP